MRPVPREDRIRICFGLDGATWDEEKVLDRFELLYEAGLVDEAVDRADLAVFGEVDVFGPVDDAEVLGTRADAGPSRAVAAGRRGGVTTAATVVAHRCQQDGTDRARCGDAATDQELAPVDALLGSRRRPRYTVCGDHVDVVVDTKVPMGDALVAVPGVTQRVGASSTFANALAMNAIMGTAIELLARRGIEPPIWQSANSPGGDEANAAHVVAFRDRIKKL